MSKFIINAVSGNVPTKWPGTDLKIDWGNPKESSAIKIVTMPVVDHLYRKNPKFSRKRKAFREAVREIERNRFMPNGANTQKEAGENGYSGASMAKPDLSILKNVWPSQPLNASLNISPPKPEMVLPRRFGDVGKPPDGAHPPSVRLLYPIDLEFNGDPRGLPWLTDLVQEVEYPDTILPPLESLNRLWFFGHSLSNQHVDDDDARA